MNKEIIDITFGFLIGILIGGGVIFYLYLKLQKKEVLLKDRLKEFYFENRLLKEKLEIHSNIKEEFKEVSSLLLNSSSNYILENSTKNIKNILTPFEEAVKNYYLNETKERFHLTKELENLNQLNSKLINESNRLTNALRGDNKFQGSWGEFILESILEKSGLRKEKEFLTQSSFKGKDGIYRPDVVVKLPNNRDIIIDSKVSLKDYEKYINEKNSEYLKKHINSIKNHIKNLSLKSYHKLEGVESIDLVLLFIPIESAFVEALKSDESLFDFAYKRDIMLVSPTTLIAVLKTVEYSWQKHYQDKNTKEIVKKANSLYEKFQGFLEDLDMAKNSLQKAQNSYERAFNKLSTGRGNILKTTDELRGLTHLFDNSSDTITGKKL